MILQIILAMFLGGICGVLFGPDVVSLGIIGKLVIQLIKAMAVPLVFFAIIDALVTTHIPLKQAFRLFLIVAINACFAVTIGLGLSNFFEPGKNLDLSALSGATPEASGFMKKSIDLKSVLTGYFPESFIQPFQENNIIGVVLLAVVIGLAIRQLMHRKDLVADPKRIEAGLLFLVKLWEQILLWIIKLVPLAVFGVMCKTVGEYGFSPLRGLAWYLAVGLSGLFIQATVVYSVWVVVFAKKGLGEFWKAAKEPLVYALGTNSSLATLPVTLRALDHLGVSKSSSRLGACVGTNFNNDGILLYEAMAVLFVAQALGMELSLSQQLSAAFLCVIAAIGVAGVPEAGVVSLSLVLTTVGISLEVLPLLLTVDWIMARARSMTNVLSDMVVSIALDGLQSRKSELG